MSSAARVRRPWRSIDRRLPLLIAGLLLVAVAGFASATYGRVRHVLLDAAGPRLGNAALAINVLFATAVRAYDAQVSGAAVDPAVTEFLRTGRDGPAARRAIGALRMFESHTRGRVELRRADGTVVLDTASAGDLPPGSPWVTRTIDTASLAPGSARIGPLFTVGDASYYEALAPVGAEPAPGDRASGGRADKAAILGYVTDFRMVTGQHTQVVRDLIGPNTALLLGSPTTGTWSDLAHPVAIPPVDVSLATPQVFRRPNGASAVGLAAAIPGTPWVLWLEQPTSQILAPMQPLLPEIAALAILVILAATAGGLVISRRVTRPIISLTAAAETLAAGRDAQFVPDEDDDEIDRLDDAFRRMAHRVEESLFTESVARAEAEAQTQEARALAAQLEQQVEEAQSLSEELEQSNYQLQRSVATADAARAEAESANRVKVDFLASMSHELRTPLNAISGYVDLLEMEVAGPIGDEQRRFLDRVKRAQGLLLRRIDEMLNFAKVDSGTLTYTLATVDLGDVLSGLVSLVQPLMVQRDLTVEYVSPATRLAARADREKCEQIVLNLLSNAMKFSVPGGRVTVTGAIEGDVAIALVSDTGVGVPADKLTAIFEPFVQVDSSLTRERPGTGLGLAISRQLARAMAGDLSVESTAGVGSTFTLRLPSAGVAPDLAATVSGRAAPSHAAVGRRDGGDLASRSAGAAPA